MSQVWGFRRGQHWERDGVVSPGLLFGGGGQSGGLRNQMALFCFPDEPARPLARSQTNTEWREGGRDAFVGETGENGL